jgi:hypothetical protein
VLENVMGDFKKIRAIERLLFVVLLIGLAGAGFMYETYKEAVRAVILVPLLIAYMLICYTIYRGMLRLAVRVLTSND